MAIALEEYDKILSRPGLSTSPGDEGFTLTKVEESVLDEVWINVAAENGVEQLSAAPSEAQIQEYYDRTR